MRHTPLFVPAVVPTYTVGITTGELMSGALY